MIILIVYLIGVVVAYGVLYGTSEKLCGHWRGNFYLSVVCSLFSWIGALAVILTTPPRELGFKFKERVS